MSPSVTHTLKFIRTSFTLINKLGLKTLKKYYFLQTISWLTFPGTLNANMKYLISRSVTSAFYLNFYTFLQTWMCQWIIYCQHQTGFTGVRDVLFPQTKLNSKLSQFFPGDPEILWLDRSLLAFGDSKSKPFTLKRRRTDSFSFVGMDERLKLCLDGCDSDSLGLKPRPCGSAVTEGQRHRTAGKLSSQVMEINVQTQWKTDVQIRLLV